MEVKTTEKSTVESSFGLFNKNFMRFFSKKKKKAQNLVSNVDFKIKAQVQAKMSPLGRRNPVN